MTVPGKGGRPTTGDRTQVRITTEQRATAVAATGEMNSGVRLALDLLALELRRWTPEQIRARIERSKE